MGSSEDNMSYKKEVGRQMIVETPVGGDLNYGKIRIKLDIAAAAVKKLLYHYQELERLHPDEVESLRSKHPKFAVSICAIG